MTDRPLALSLLPDRLAVCRLPADAPLPDWATGGGFVSITRTARELSVVCPEPRVPAGVAREGGWRAGPARTRGTSSGSRGRGRGIMGVMAPSPPGRVFLLSPADCAGERARLVISPRAAFPLARRLRDGGAPLGEVMSFMSGLYFRGKLAYARAFARPPAGTPGVLVITSSAGLLPADHVVTLAELRRFARGDVDPDRPGYRRPLTASAAALAPALGDGGEVVLLGSIATEKYASPLAPIFGPRLLFPRAFVGIGDMSRGALLLRAVRAGAELEYVALVGAIRHRPRG